MTARALVVALTLALPGLAAAQDTAPVISGLMINGRYGVQVPVWLVLRQAGRPIASFDVEVHSGLWKVTFGPHATEGDLTLEAIFDLGRVWRPEARDFRLQNAAARQGLHDHLERKARLRRP